MLPMVGIEYRHANKKGTISSSLVEVLCGEATQMEEPSVEAIPMSEGDLMEIRSQVR